MSVARLAQPQPTPRLQLPGLSCPYVSACAPSPLLRSIFIAGQGLLSANASKACVTLTRAQRGHSLTVEHRDSLILRASWKFDHNWLLATQNEPKVTVPGRTRSCACRTANSRLGLPASSSSTSPASLMSFSPHLDCKSAFLPSSSTPPLSKHS